MAEWLSDILATAIVHYNIYQKMSLYMVLQKDFFLVITKPLRNINCELNYDKIKTAI